MRSAHRVYFRAFEKNVPLCGTACMRRYPPRRILQGPGFRAPRGHAFACRESIGSGLAKACFSVPLKPGLSAPLKHRVGSSEGLGSGFGRPWEREMEGNTGDTLKHIRGCARENIATAAKAAFPTGALLRIDEPQRCAGFAQLYHRPSRAFPPPVSFRA